MFSRTQAPLEIALERATISAINEMTNQSIGSAEYVKMLDIVIKLHKLKEEETSQPVSKDTLAIVGANLIGILMIIKHERLNVITSRAMNLVLKPR